MQDEEKREKLFNEVNPISRSDIDLEGQNVSGEIGLGDKWVIERLLADFMMLEYIDVSNGQFVDEDGFVVVKQDKKVWRKAVVRGISPWCEKHFGLKYGDVVLLPNDKGLKIGETQYEDPEGNVHVMECGTFVNGLKVFGVLKQVK